MEGDTERKYKVWLRVEIMVLFAVIVVVWGLLLLPVVFYYLPVDTRNVNSNEILRKESTCAVPIVYTGSACQEELLSMKSCYMSNDDTNADHDYPTVATDAHIKDAELALSYLQLGLASSECEAEVVPFLCLYFFGLCDVTNENTYQPSAGQCRNLRDRVCNQEWTYAVNFGLELPDCDVDFPAESVSCRDKAEGKGNSLNASGSGSFELTTELQHLDCSNITCRQGFYCIDGANNAVCNPSCASWKQYPDSINAVFDSLLLISLCVGVICGVGVLVLAGLRRNKVLTFPSSLVVYQTITVLLAGLFVLIGYIDSTLYCVSEDLYATLSQATPFCIITGAIFFYCTLQLSMFWLCHIAAIFWGLKFPFHARTFRTTHRIKYLHIACVALCTILPLIPIVGTMVQYSRGKSFGEAVEGGLGFGVVRFPPILCTGRDQDAMFYALILPVVVLLMAGMTVLIITFWIIHKQHGLFKARQSKNPHKIGTAERKILIVFIYYILLAVFAILGFSLATRGTNRFISEVIRYFDCERRGVDPDNLCDASGYINISNVCISLLSYVLIGMYPLINFIYVIDVHELKQFLRGHFPSLFKASELPERTQTGTKFLSRGSSSNNSTAGILSNYSQEFIAIK